jgi:hypothetical protein
MVEVPMKRVLAVLGMIAATFAFTSSHAVVVGIDSFAASGTNSSGPFGFTDNFSDGDSPPCGPAPMCGQPNFYGVNSTNPLPSESGNFLQLDSSNGISSANATGGARLDETVQVGGEKSKLLSTGGAISMAGIFTLPVLSGPLNEGYGIRFIDGPPGSGPGTNQEVLELNVQWWTGTVSIPAGWYVRYLVQDFVNHTIQTIGADLVDIPLGADEILLSLDRDGGSDMFEATYAYGTGVTFGTSTSLGFAQGFLHENYVRPQFHAFETVPAPEPDTLFLAGAGVILLVAARRRPPLRC